METLQSAACGGVVKKLVIMTSLGVSILASDALAIDLAIKGTASESLAASNNYFEVFVCELHFHHHCPEFNRYHSPIIISDLVL